MFARGPHADYDVASQRHCMINLLSVIIRVPRCHMATFMLQPEILRNTWLVGSTYPSATAHYDCGCVLDEQHLPVGARAPLTDPASVYFVHILSFSALLVGYLVLPDNHAKLYQPLLSPRQIHTYRGDEADSDWCWLSGFMYMRVETCWQGLIRRAGLDAMGRLLTLTAAIEGLCAALADNLVTQPTFASTEARGEYEAVLKDTFHQQLMKRQQLEEKYLFEANGGQLQQQLRTFASTLPWVYELQIAALADATTHHTTLQDYLALQVSQQQQQNGQTNTLLDNMLAQQSKWEHLQLIPLGLEIYQWASHSLTGLATEEAVRSTSLHQYLQRARHRNSTDADKMSQVYQRFKLSWNAFHKAQDGYMRDACQEDARFAPVTDDTPLSFFISWEDAATDDYILRVLRNVLDIQNRFMAIAQENALSAAASLLRDPTFSLGLLDCSSLGLESIIPSYLHSSTSVLPEFDLGSMTKHLVSWLHSKHIITDDLYKIRRVFQPWQPDPAPLLHNITEGAGDARPLELGAAQRLPLAYRQALPPQQYSTLSSISFQQLHDMQHALQQVAAAVVHNTNLACASSTQQAVCRTLQPTDSLSAAVAAANPDSKLKGADFMTGLTLVHVHAALLMPAEKAAAKAICMPTCRTL